MRETIDQGMAATNTGKSAPSVTPAFVAAAPPRFEKAKCVIDKPAPPAAAVEGLAHDGRDSAALKEAVREGQSNGLPTGWFHAIGKVFQCGCGRIACTGRRLLHTVGCGTRADRHLAPSGVGRRLGQRLGRASRTHQHAFSRYLDARRARPLGRSATRPGRLRLRLYLRHDSSLRHLHFLLGSSPPGPSFHFRHTLLRNS
jgi:hypothetical protein